MKTSNLWFSGPLKPVLQLRFLNAVTHPNDYESVRPNTRQRPSRTNSERKKILAKAIRLDLIRKQQTILEEMQAATPIRYVTVVLDSKCGHAIVERRETILSGKPIADYEFTDWHYHEAPEIWFPHYCVASCYTNGPFDLGPSTLSRKHITPTNSLQSVLVNKRGRNSAW
ncbi:MAG: hypothetical protein M2R45_02227 [Verrucomicrobia subdivision 3 bacterium]|nr:hypothetical protein [Limisphaerales bacterium]MCS1413988.1 hypothetical protein [Limisphaerales bacterium]